MRRTTTVLVIATGGMFLANALPAQQYQEDWETSRYQREGFTQDRSSRIGQRQTGQRSMTQRERRLQQQVNVVRAADLIGTDVQTMQGQSLGEVHDVVISQPDGDIAYVVVGSGGFLGMAQRFHALPPQTLRFAEDEDVLLTNVSQQQFERQYAIDADRWPHPMQYTGNSGHQPQGQSLRSGWQQRGTQGQGSGAAFGGRQDPYRDRDYDVRYQQDQRFGQSPYGQDPYGQDGPIDREVRWGYREYDQGGGVDIQQERPTDREVRWGYRGDDEGSGAEMRQDGMRQDTAMRGMAERDMWMYRVSELRGRKVIDQNNDTAGEISDLALDLRQGRVTYALVDVNGWARQEIVAVPFQALQLDTRRQAFHVDVAAQTLAQAPRISEATDLGDPRIAQQINQYWGDTQVFAFPGQQQFRGQQQYRDQQQFQQQYRDPQYREQQYREYREPQYRDQQYRDYREPPYRDQPFRDDTQWQQQQRYRQQWQEQPQQFPQQQYRDQQSMQQREMMMRRSQQYPGVEMRANVEDVQQQNGWTRLEVRGQDGRQYQVQLPETVRLYIAPDGRALLLADDVYRDGQRIRRQDVQQLQQQMQSRRGQMQGDDWQTYGFQQGQQEQSQQQQIQAQIQHAEQQQNQTRIQLQDQQGRQYTAQIGMRGQIQVFQNGQVGLLMDDIRQNGQPVQLQPSRQIQQGQAISLRGQIQQVDQDQIRFQSEDGQIYTLELDRQVQIVGTSGGQAILMGQSLLRNGQNVEYRMLQEQQQRQQR